MNIKLRLFTLLRVLALASLSAGISAQSFAQTYAYFGEGTVTDTNTGLTWMRCALGQSWTGSTCTGAAASLTLSEVRYPGIAFAGFNDWRLPNIRELRSITNLSATYPAVDALAFPETPASVFWSSTEVSTSFTSRSAWGVNFSDGATGMYIYEAYQQSYPNLVRLVRGNSSLDPSPTGFVDNFDGTVTHTPTGLMWPNCVKGQTWAGTGPYGADCNGSATVYNWASAAAITDPFAGHSDWRLPTIKELETLVDYRKPQIFGVNHSLMFPSAAALGSFWSSSPYANDPQRAWSVFFAHGTSGGGTKDFALQVRLVRVGRLVYPQVFEFYNNLLDNYFITANTIEAAAIDNGAAGPGWSRTGNAFASGGNTAVCRFYGSQSPGPNSHFYTAELAECEYLKQLQAGTPATQKRWNFESLDFQTTVPINGVCTGGTVPIYRAYNNGFTRGIDSNHRITRSLAAIQEVVNRGWANEGVVMCAPQ